MPLDETAVPVQFPPVGLYPDKLKLPPFIQILSIDFPKFSVGFGNTIKLFVTESCPHSFIAFRTTV